MRKKSRINQKGGILSWIIFFIVIMMIFGVLLFLQSHSQKNIPSEKQTTSESEKKDGKKFATPELTEEEKRERDNVRLNEALRQGTPEACETIEFDSELKQNCIENTWFALAIKEENENTCAIGNLGADPKPLLRASKVRASSVCARCSTSSTN